MSPCWGSAGPGRGRRGRRYWGRVRARVRRRGRVGDDEAALLVPLHVPHTPQRLDLGVGSFPVVPVLEVPLLEDELAPPVARVQVSHPPGGWEHTGGQKTAVIIWTSELVHQQEGPEPLLFDSWTFGTESSAVRGELSRLCPNQT